MFEKAQMLRQLAAAVGRLRICTLAYDQQVQVQVRPNRCRCPAAGSQCTFAKQDLRRRKCLLTENPRPQTVQS